MPVTITEKRWGERTDKSSWVIDFCYVHPLPIHVFELPTSFEHVLAIHVYFNRRPKHLVLMYARPDGLVQLGRSLKYITFENIVMLLECKALEYPSRGSWKWLTAR